MSSNPNKRRRFDDHEGGGYDERDRGRGGYEDRRSDDRGGGSRGYDRRDDRDRGRDYDRREDRDRGRDYDHRDDLDRDRRRDRDRDRDCDRRDRDYNDDDRYIRRGHDFDRDGGVPRQMSGGMGGSSYGNYGGGRSGNDEAAALPSPPPPAVRPPGREHDVSTDTLGEIEPAGNSGGGSRGGPAPGRGGGRPPPGPPAGGFGGSRFELGPPLANERPRLAGTPPNFLSMGEQERVFNFLKNSSGSPHFICLDLQMSLLPDGQSFELIWRLVQQAGAAGISISALRDAINPEVVRIFGRSLRPKWLTPYLEQMPSTFVLDLSARLVRAATVV
jgi:hypothetical protein